VKARPPNGPSGILLADKPERLTSHDVVDVVRRLLGTRRIGHTGTLDPVATGLLVLCVGRAVRLQSFLTGVDKSYEGEMRFGIETDTYDRDGTPVGTPHPDPRPAIEAVRAAASAYTGELRQTPPPYSAKKIAGKKLYELARRGESPAIEPKSVRVSALTIRGVSGDRATFSVSCSSGTYVRSLVHDIGRDLGLGAHLVDLRRTAVGPFRIEDAASLSFLEGLPAGARTVPPHWIPLAAVPLPYPAVPVAPAEAARVRRGHAVPVKLPANAAGAAWVRLLADDELLALCQLEPLGRGILALARPKIVLQD
jgi:tRNA pseudouridine55 synthase